MSKFKFNKGEEYNTLPAKDRKVKIRKTLAITNLIYNTHF